MPKKLFSKKVHSLAKRPASIFTPLFGIALLILGLCAAIILAFVNQDNRGSAAIIAPTPTPPPSHFCHRSTLPCQNIVVSGTGTSCPSGYVYGWVSCAAPTPSPTSIPATPRPSAAPPACSIQGYSLSVNQTLCTSTAKVDGGYPCFKCVSAGNTTFTYCSACTFTASTQNGNGGTCVAGGRTFSTGQTVCTDTSPNAQGDFPCFRCDVANKPYFSYCRSCSYVSPASPAPSASPGSATGYCTNVYGYNLKPGESYCTSSSKVDNAYPCLKCITPGNTQFTYCTACTYPKSSGN